MVLACAQTVNQIYVLYLLAVDNLFVQFLNQC